MQVVATPQPPAPPATRAPVAYVAAPPMNAPPQPPPVLPPSVPHQVPHPSTSEPSEEEEEWEEEEPQPRNGLVFGCLLGLLFLGIVGGILAAITVGVMVVRKYHSPTEPGETMPDAVAEQGPEKIRFGKNDGYWWTDASARSLTYAGITVRIDRAAFATPRFQSRDEILSTSEDYLLISLTITNQSKKDVTYKSWYSYKFEDEEGNGSVEAEIVDDEGNAFELFPIPGADRVEQHIHSEYYIAQDDAISDTLVFKLPANYSREKRRSFRLSLPAAAVEQNDAYRFKIPAFMITESINPPMLQPLPAGPPT